MNAAGCECSTTGNAMRKPRAFGWYDAVGFVGCGLLVYGCYLIHKGLGYVIAGLILTGFAYFTGHVRQHLGHDEEGGTPQ